MIIHHYYFGAFVDQTGLIVYHMHLITILGGGGWWVVVDHFGAALQLHLEYYIIWTKFHLLDRTLDLFSFLDISVQFIVILSLQNSL